jgi:hypothetical protein
VCLPKSVKASRPCRLLLLLLLPPSPSASRLQLTHRQLERKLRVIRTRRRSSLGLKARASSSLKGRQTMERAKTKTCSRIRTKAHPHLPILLPLRMARRRLEQPIALLHAATAARDGASSASSETAVETEETRIYPNRNRSTLTTRIQLIKESRRRRKRIKQPVHFRCCFHRPLPKRAVFLVAFFLHCVALRFCDCIIVQVLYFWRAYSISIVSNSQKQFGSSG